MEIKKTDGYTGPQVTKVQEAETKVDSVKRPDSSKETSTQGSTDRVELSKDYQELNKVKRVTMELPDVRSERVDQVRKQIADNTYQVKAPDRRQMLEELMRWCRPRFVAIKVAVVRGQVAFSPLPRFTFRDLPLDSTCSITCVLDAPLRSFPGSYDLTVRQTAAMNSTYRN
jgi:negative regulator of flagellin synthesis FlgM